MKPCPNGKKHDVHMTYDVPNDEYFVACMTCDAEGQRRSTEKNAKAAWNAREMSREGIKPSSLTERGKSDMSDKTDERAADADDSD